jgi:predicted transcriptional regulator
MDDLSFVRAELEHYDYARLAHLERETGVPAGTMAKIKGGQTADPRYSTVRKLADYFRGNARGCGS